MTAIQFSPLDLCQLCHPLLRFTESCAQHPDLLQMPQMIKQEDMYLGEQLAEMREMQVTFTTFREHLLLNENMQPFVMNLILYGTTFFEVAMVTVSFFAMCIPVLFCIAYLTTRKPDFCRALVFYLSAKTCFYFFNDDSFKMPMSDKLYICTLNGQLRESSGFSEQCFLISSFFTYLVLSTLMSMNSILTENVIQRMNLAFYGMIAGAVYMFALYLAKMHLMLYSQTFLVTSIELGMGFAILFLVLMVSINMWPIRLQACFVDAFPTEEFLLNHLCLKWDIDTEVSKLEKMTRIKYKLEEVLKIKADFDRKARFLAQKPQKDPLVYRELIKGPMWDQMNYVIDEMLNAESRTSYYELQEQIWQLKDVEKLEELKAQEPAFNFSPATKDGQKIFAKLKQGTAGIKSRVLKRKMQKVMPQNMPMHELDEAVAAVSGGQGAGAIFKPRLQLPAMTSTSRQLPPMQSVPYVAQEELQLPAQIDGKKSKKARSSHRKHKKQKGSQN